MVFASGMAAITAVLYVFVEDARGPVVVPDDDKGATVDITGVVAEKLEDNRVAVDLTARSGDAKVLTRARAVVRLA